ncbi:hypothetical protein EHE19_016955 [Ruminiclostridium herbifermentans]|uniref:Uncharacterized protein n=1 Tax=Ruminiclostridium herbifermentans TaxID=2488810 RepID=A0A4U7JBT2_9FIRM|nr:hypothetical protein [Ruminiclostridium herbifermentans]QNU66523.1 hypothetical protein EHE19_016955 [Ruminiclostridium herbifermentans]
MDKPWIDGPKELLMHAAEHLNNNGDFDRRIALISIDNAVELTIKTYLSLPKRIRKTEGPSRKELQEAENSFPTYLDLLEKYDAKKVSDINIDDIEWYHRLRNQLYHAGNGMTIEVSKVEAYFEIARGLFDSIFNVNILNDFKFAYTTNIGKFMEIWTGFEKKLRSRLPPKGEKYAYYWKRDFLASIDSRLVPVFNEVMDFRDNVVHGQLEATTKDYKEIIDKIEYINSALY